MHALLVIGGLYNIAFALFHISFWKLFHWGKELKKLDFANRAIMQIFNVQMIYYFIFVAFICFAFPDDLLTTRLGNVFLAGNALFWLIRLIQQFIFLRVRSFKVHFLTVIFLVGTILFALPLILK